MALYHITVHIPCLHLSVLLGNLFYLKSKLNIRISLIICAYHRGYRVTAQSIIPGILEREQEQSVIYGSIDFGKTVVSHPKYLELLEKTSRPLKVQHHSVLNEKDTAVELCSSVECKGIIGNDGRHYILDLLRTFPPDLNFLPVEGEELNPESQKQGFPRQHRHRLACLRQELIEAFVEHRYSLPSSVRQMSANGADQ